MIFTLFNKLKTKKFKVATVLDVLFVAFIFLCFVLWNEVNAAEQSAYEYLYNDEPRITQTWAYRIDMDCPDEYKDAIRFRMDSMAMFYNTRFLSETVVHGYGDKQDGTWLFHCDDDFSSSLIAPIEGVQQTVETIKDKYDNGTQGRAHIYWRDKQMLEVDIQLRFGLDAEELQYVVDHEIGHGSGCAHNVDNVDALMFPFGFVGGWHVDDLQCLNHLYGPLPFSIRDSHNNVLVPQAVDMNGLSGWAVLKSGTFSVEDFGQ